MDGAGDLFSMRRTVAGQFVGNEPPRPLALSLEKPAKEAGGGFAVPPCLDEDIRDPAILIHGPIHIA
jgi:hypothetical protein